MSRTSAAVPGARLVPRIGDAEDTATGVFRQRLFTVEGDTLQRRVPLALWTPLSPTPPFPLVLIGHGGGGHKLDDSRLNLARRYTLAGFAAAAIDGPWHGERAGGAPEAWSEAVVDSMVADWQATLDALLTLDELDGERVGYGGVSMGTMFGLPFVASDRRVRAAALGLCGFRNANGSPLEIAERLGADAVRLECPVFFLVQWDDELFERASSFELWHAIGSRDKRIFANPGLHHETPEHSRAASVAFLIEQLRAPQAAP